jgi:hypothetical protein
MVAKSLKDWPQILFAGPMSVSRHLLRRQMHFGVAFFAICAIFAILQFGQKIWHTNFLEKKQKTKSGATPLYLDAVRPNIVLPPAICRQNIKAPDRCQLAILTPYHFLY